MERLTIERRPMPEAHDELERLIAAGSPVLLENALAGWPCVEAWSNEYLRRRVGHQEVVVTHSDGPLFGGDPEKGHYTPDVLHRMPFGEFLDLLATSAPGGRRYYLHRADLFRSLPELADDVRVPAFVRSAPFHSVLLWMGSAPSITQLHHDFTDNLFAMVRGRKRVLLYPPTQEAYRFPVQAHGERSSWHLSRVGTVLREDVDRFPAIHPRHALDVVVEPGQMLVIPAFWWHEVHTLDQPSISLAYWWDHRPEQDIQDILRRVTAFTELYRTLPEDWRRLVRRVLDSESSGIP